MMFYLNGLTAVTNLWLRDDCRRPVEEIAKLIQDCIFGRDPSLLSANDENYG